MRFEEHYPNGVPHRDLPLTPGECDSMLRESTEDEVNAAKHLPYRERDAPCQVEMRLRQYASPFTLHTIGPASCLIRGAWC